MSEAILAIRDFAVTYGGRTVLEVDELIIHRRETLTLVGPNGAGKSTLLKALGLLETPARGTLWFNGEQVRYQRRQLLNFRRRMAVILQEPLLCRTSVYHNVALGLRFRGVSTCDRNRRVNRWLERLGIAHLRGRQAAGLSGGEAQRVNLARAFVLEPEVLLLDEPFTALDPPTRETLLTELQELLAEARTTTIFVTHDRGETLVLGDRVAVLLGGRLVQWGSPEEIFTQPANEDVARFVGMETLIPGCVVAAADGLVMVDTGCGPVTVHGSWGIGESVFVCLRPEDVTLARDTVPVQDNRNVLTGSVLKVIPLDASVRVVVDCRVPVIALLMNARFRDLALGVGHKVRASFASTAAHLIPRRQTDTP
ncbi:Fe(3+) ions import ATP-binding protein FbpC [Candidatus Entotheonellaceae bacterium PAL068K]